MNCLRLLNNALNDFASSRDRHEQMCSIEDFNRNAIFFRKTLCNPEVMKLDYPVWKIDVSLKTLDALELLFNHIRQEVRHGVDYPRFNSKMKVALSLVKTLQQIGQIV